MYYCYLFEAKSIQEYLFQSNKLKDVISASERLDRLIDSETTSVLYQVLEISNITSDLLDTEVTHSVDINFLRCKGGAFYGYSLQFAPLQKLRSCWTLTLSQLFPSLVYTDALTEGETLQLAMDHGLNAVNAARNAPSPHFPITQTIIERYSKTGRGMVPLTHLEDGTIVEKAFENDKALDIDTDLHRQAYQRLGLRDNAALQDRFTPPELAGKVRYPIDFEKQFEFTGTNVKLSKYQRQAIKDMALIHIDGNGLGILLRQLKLTLQQQDDAIYCHAFRHFSNALNKATIDAARIATRQLYQHVIAESGQENNTKQCVLPMRPIVLGGDDITLFCRADLALEYAETFCREFKLRSEQELKQLFATHLKDSHLLPYITASGGILYHKAGHPFTHSHQLVEALCKKAKRLTKGVYGKESNKVGPAALAFYRVSNATQSQLELLLQQAQTFNIDNNGKDITLTLGQVSYFIDPLTEAEKLHIDQHQHLQLLRDLLPLSINNNKSDPPPILMAKWRQLVGLVAQYDIQEAQRVFNRSLELCKNKPKVAKLNHALAALVPNDCDAINGWYWCRSVNNSQYFTFINDLLIIEHFQPVSIAIPSLQQEDK